MPPAPAQLTFVSSLFASKIFWAQVVTLAAMILSAAGVKVLDTPGAQEQAIGILDALATMGMRLWFPTGPVSLSAPATVPATMDVPSGSSALWVPAPGDKAQAATVKLLPPGTHEITVTPAVPASPPS